MNKKSLTQNGLTLPNVITIIVSLITIGIGIYLTKHYFSIHFPSGIESSDSFCSISDFWSCDKATNSNLSSLFGIPTSIFGLFIGVIFLFGSFVPSESTERTNKFIALINGIGCFGLFIYSIIALGGLCPMCTAYYACSWILLFLFHKYGVDGYRPEIKPLAISVILFSIVGGVTIYQIREKETQKGKLTKVIYSKFTQLKEVGEPEKSSGKFLNLSGQNFGDGKIRMTIFSDFQCPFCKKFEEIISNLVKRFPDALDVQYFAYPLDPTCNSNIKRAMHPMACKAAALTECVPSEKFKEVHDNIFEHQSELSQEFINELAKKYNALECSQSEEAMAKVRANVSTGDKIKVQGTPTVLINGKKLSAGLPLYQWIALFEGMLK